QWTKNRITICIREWQMCQHHRVEQWILRLAFERLNELDEQLALQKPIVCQCDRLEVCELSSLRWWSAKGRQLGQLRMPCQECNLWTACIPKRPTRIA